MNKLQKILIQIPKIKKYFSFTKKDILFGIIVIIIAYYLNQISNSLKGFYYLPLPQQGNNAFYFKELPNKNQVALFLRDNNFTRIIYYQIRNLKDNKLYKGYLTIPNNYYNNQITILIKDKNISLVYKEDYLTEQFNKKQMQILEKYIKTHFNLDTKNTDMLK